MSTPKKNKRLSPFDIICASLGIILLIVLFLTINKPHKETPIQEEESQNINIATDLPTPSLDVFLDNVLPTWEETYRIAEEAGGMLGGGAILPTSDFDMAYIWCTDQHSCLHETGHAMHHFLGVNEWKFKEDLEDYTRTALAVACTRDIKRERTFDCLLMNFPGMNGNEAVDGWWGYEGEFYASVYAHWMEGKFEIPETLIHYWRGY